MSNFHTHSYYSPRDSIMSPEDIALFQKNTGKDWFSITDHGSMACHPEAFEIAKKHGMKFLAGVEFYVKPDNKFDGKTNIPLVSEKTKRSRLKSISDEEKTVLNKELEEIKIDGYNINYHHLTAIAFNQKGLENLYKINNNGDFYYKTRAIKEDLLKYNEGIVILSGCPGGAFMKMIELGYDDEAIKWMNDFKDVYKDRIYFELMYHDGVYDSEPIKPVRVKVPNNCIGDNTVSKTALLDYLKENHINYKEIEDLDSLVVTIERVGNEVFAECSVIETNADKRKRKAKAERDIYIKGIKLARKCGVKIVGSNDSHYLNPEDKNKWLITRKAMIGNDKDFTGDYHLMQSNKYFESIYESYVTEEELIESEKEIASRYEDYGIFKSKFHSSINDMKELEKLVWAGFKNKRIGTEFEEESLLQIPYELSVIQTRSFDKYFLTTRDIVKAAAEKGVLVGPGRGSAAGSEIVYLTGITSADPLKYGLMFERFINPGRNGFPDIDLDLSSTSCVNFKPNEEYKRMFFESHQELPSDKEIQEYWDRYSKLREEKKDNRRKGIFEVSKIKYFEGFIGDNSGIYK